MFLLSWGGRAALGPKGVAPQFPFHLLLCWTFPGDLLLLEELGQAQLQLSFTTSGCFFIICAQLETVKFQLILHLGVPKTRNGLRKLSLQACIAL